MSEYFASLRSQLVNIVASTEYANLKPLASFNVATQYAAFLMTSALVIHQSSVDGKEEHADVIFRAFSMLAPQAREKTTQTSTQLTKTARMLGIREYYEKYVMLRDPIPILFDNHVARAAALLTDEWKVPGQGADYNMGTTATSIVETSKKELEMVQAKWSVHLSKWREMTLPAYNALNVENRAKVDYLVANPDATELPASYKLATLDGEVEETRTALDKMLAVRQDSIVMAEAEKGPLVKSQEHVDMHIQLCKNQAAKLDELECQFHAAKKMYDEYMERLDSWKVVRDEAQATHSRYQESIRDANTQVCHWASCFFIVVNQRTQAAAENTIQVTDAV